MVGTTVKIQIFVRHDMESEVDNIGKVARLVKDNVRYHFNVTHKLEGYFLSSSMGDSYYHLPLGVNVK